MLSQMRQGQFIKTVLWVVVVTFVATMIFVWGADLQGSGCGTRAPQGEQWAGMVGKQPISLAEYDRRLREAISQMAQGREPGQVISEDERLRVSDQIFQQMVNEALFKQEVDRMGLEPSDQEIGDVLQYDPPDFLKQQFRDEQGNFNQDAYQLALNNPNVDWKPLEAFVRSSLPAERLQQMLMSSVHVGEGEVRQEYERRFRKMTVRYAGQTWRDVVLENENPGDETLRAYFQSHLDDYQLDERYRIDAVRFSRDPSPEDDAYVKDRMDFLRQQILQGGKTFDQMAKEWSQDLSNADKGGNLGWFGKGVMDPAFEQAAFALKEGEVSQPVRTRFGYHLIKLDGKRDEAGQEEVSARHILLRVEPSFATQDSLTTLADSLYAQATRDGSLATAAASLGVEGLSPPPFTQRQSIEGIGFNSSVKSRVERMKPGEITKSFAARDADYLVQLMEVLPAGPSDFDTERDKVTRDWRESQQRAVARQKAAALRAAIDAGASLDAAAKELGLEAVETDPFARRDYIPGVGRQGAFQDAAFIMNPGETSGVVETQEGAYVFTLLTKPESDKTSFPTERDKIRERLLSSAQQRFFESWMTELKKRFPVKDYRDQYYK